MNAPEWLKLGISGALIGAIFVGIVGFAWGGWVTGGNANKMAMTMAHDDVIVALVPVCVSMSRSDAGRASKIAMIEEASSYRKRSVLMETGWATVPGAEEPNRDLALACVAALELDGS